jgi:hypothetical protein
MIRTEAQERRRQARLLRANRGGTSDRDAYSDRLIPV